MTWGERPPAPPPSEKEQRIAAHHPAGGSGAEPSPLSIPRLRETFSGRVIAPGDPDYDAARTVFAGGIDRHPAAIVRVADASDVARVIALARETGLELAVRSGGHSALGHSVSEGGIVLDLADLRGLEIDAPGRTAWAQTGLTAAEYTNATAVHDLATGFGDTGSVGIGGLTLGGGIGFLVRKHGLTIDSLLAADVVTADGQTLRVDAEHHPDLFWAIRGGGGNFGVATRFLFRLHEVGTVYGGMLILPATPEVVAGFIAAADAAPEEISTIANVMTAPPMPFVPEEAFGRLILMAILVYAGPPEAGERAVAPLRALANPIADLLRPMRYPEIYMPEDPTYHPVAVGRTLFMDRVDLPMAEEILSRLEASDAPMRVAQLRVLGGAMARVPVEGSPLFDAGAVDTPRLAALTAVFILAMADCFDGVEVVCSHPPHEDILRAGANAVVVEVGAIPRDNTFACAEWRGLTMADARDLLCRAGYDA